MDKLVYSVRDNGIGFDAKYAEEIFQVFRKLHSDGEYLHEGDVLYADEERVLVVELLPCELTEIEVHSMKEMGHLCFELGNRHLSLAIEDDRVTVPYDARPLRILISWGLALQK